MLLPVQAVAAALLPALAAALEGGPAVLPLPPDPERLLAAVRPDEPLEDDVALVVPTSGSTGEPKGVLLSARALTASALATADRLGGLGRWLLAIPPTHIGGLQVLVRSLLSGTDPVVLPAGPFTAAAFTTGTARLGTGRRLVSLVPTQLTRLLDDSAGRHPAGGDCAGGDSALDALRSYDAVLLGGAAAAPALLARARDAGVHVVSTYGMSETAGGCVYDGVPLDGVRVEVVDALVRLAGPVLASGYRLRPDLTAVAFTDGSFTTGDVGRIEPDGTLVVLGRADDVVVTGGEKVPPLAVEAAIGAHPAVSEAGVVGLPDEQWGARVVACVVLATGSTAAGSTAAGSTATGSAALTLEDLRDHVARTLPRRWAPRQLLVLDRLPALPSGKLDRAALRSWAALRTPGAPRPEMDA